MADHTLTPTQSMDLELGVDTATLTDEMLTRELDGLDATLDAGSCPWCNDYEGDNPRMHAPKSHPNRWTAYRRARDDG